MALPPHQPLLMHPQIGKGLCEPCLHPPWNLTGFVQVATVYTHAQLAEPSHFKELMKSRSDCGGGGGVQEESEGREVGVAGYERVKQKGSCGGFELNKLYEYIKSSSNQ